jgi:hypothetical protein
MQLIVAHHRHAQSAVPRSIKKMELDPSKSIGTYPTGIVLSRAPAIVPPAPHFLSQVDANDGFFDDNSRMIANSEDADVFLEIGENFRVDNIRI